MLAFASTSALFEEERFSLVVLLSETTSSSPMEPISIPPIMDSMLALAANRAALRCDLLSQSQQAEPTDRQVANAEVAYGRTS